MSRPIGSKTKKPNAYATRSKTIRDKYGKDAYKRWGKLGGNPILISKDKG